MRLSATRFNLGLLLWCEETGDDAGAGHLFYGVTDDTLDQCKHILAELSDKSKPERSKLLQKLSQIGRAQVWEHDLGRSKAPRVIQPGADAPQFWRTYGALPFEAAFDATGLSEGAAGVVIRGTGAKARPPFTVGPERLRVLVVTASPMLKALPIAGTEAARMKARQSASHGLLDVRIVQGADTIEQLKRLSADEAPQWDIVHIVAHGSRRNGAICLCTPQQDDHWESFEDFTELLAGCIRGTRLFTLAVCDSSPLAAAIADRFQGAEAVGFLAETSTEGIADFYGAFYDALFKWPPPAPAVESGVHVVGAFGQSVRRLHNARNPEWMLATLYGPAEPLALLDVGRIADQFEKIERIESLAKRGNLVDARREAEGQRRNKSQPVLADWASRFVRECDDVIQYQRSLDSLAESLQAAADHEPVWEGFEQVYDHWRDRDLAAVDAAGAATVAAGAAPDMLEILTDLQTEYLTLHREAMSAAATLAELGRAANDWVDRLVNGALRLREFLKARQLDPGVSSKVVSKVVADRIQDVLDRLGSAGSEDQVRESLDAARGAVEELDRLADEAKGPLGADDADAVRAQRQILIRRSLELELGSAAGRVDRACEALGQVERLESMDAAVDAANRELNSAELVAGRAKEDRFDSELVGRLRASITALKSAIKTIKVDVFRRQIERLGARLVEASDPMAEQGALLEAIDAVRQGESDASLKPLRPELSRLLEVVRGKIPRRAARAGVPFDLAEPGRRMELIDRLRALGDEEPPSADPEETAEDLESLRRRIEHAAGRPDDAGGVDRLNARQLSAAANEAAPVRLVATLAEAQHPYLVTHARGGDADTKADVFLRIETEVTGLPESPVKSALQSALSQLTRDSERVCVDALTLPCVEPEKVAAAASKALAAMLRGLEPEDSLLDGVADADRPTVLALMGRTREASRLAVEQAVTEGLKGSREDLERVRAAYLHTVHDIRCDLEEVELPDLVELRERLCTAVGLLGLIDGDPNLESWVKVRFAIYGSFSPTEDEALAASVRLHLRRRLEELLNLLELREGAAEVADAVRCELKAETIAVSRCAALGVSRTAGVVFQGGYNGARLFGYLPSIGERLRFVQRRLIEMSYQDYVAWLIDKRIDKDQFHELVIAMCGARWALVDPAHAQKLRRRLPPANGLQAGEVADVRDLVDDETAYPMHSGLPPDEAAHFLSAHFAWALAHVHIVQLEEALESFERQDVMGPIRRSLSTVDQMGAYLAALDYRITGEAVEFSTAVERTCTRWVKSLLDHNNQRKDLEDADADKAWRERYGIGCKVADELKEFPVLAGTGFQQAVRLMHLTYGVFLSNIFRDYAGAYEHTKKGYSVDDGRSLNQFLIAANNQGLALWRPGASLAVNAEGLKMLEEAERIAAAFHKSHPDDPSGVKDTLERLRQSIEAVRRNRVEEGSVTIAESIARGDVKDA